MRYKSASFASKTRQTAVNSLQFVFIYLFGAVFVKHIKMYFVLGQIIFFVLISNGMVDSNTGDEHL